MVAERFKTLKILVLAHLFGQNVLCIELMLRDRVVFLEDVQLDGLCDAVVAL